MWSTRAVQHWRTHHFATCTTARNQGGGTVTPASRYQKTKKSTVSSQNADPENKTFLTEDVCDNTCLWIVFEIQGISFQIELAKSLSFRRSAVEILHRGSYTEDLIPSIQALHCGCIVSRTFYSYADTGGVVCIECGLKEMVFCLERNQPLNIHAFICRQRLSASFFSLSVCSLTLPCYLQKHQPHWRITYWYDHRQWWTQRCYSLQC